MRRSPAKTIGEPLMRSFLVAVLVLLGFTLADADEASRSPTSTGDRSVNGSTSSLQPGALYREYSLHNGGDQWRVTDPEAAKKFDAANDFLPNPQWSLIVDDLQHAVRAEVLLDRWGGHRGTINKRLRFNDGPWVIVPEIVGTPKDIRPEMLMFQDNPVIEYPLKALREGENKIEAMCDEAGGFGWGQWGLYSLVLRVHYDRDAKANQLSNVAIASPVSGATVGDFPEVEVKATATEGVVRVDVFANYDGLDEDGDGRFDGWHQSRFQMQRGQPNSLRHHVGSRWSEPHRCRWDTQWVPDQAPSGIQLIARAKNTRGYWTVSAPIKNVTLRRPYHSVRRYVPRDVPEDFAVRVGETKECWIDLPDDFDDHHVLEAVMHLRTWHGEDDSHIDADGLSPIQLNSHRMLAAGKNHHYDDDLLSLPVTALQPGANRFAIDSDTDHHMLEVLWPGPTVLVRAAKPAGGVQIHEGRYQGRSHFVIETPPATYWLDKQSGGLSRLIDADGLDWIAFKKIPWGEYPAAAASSFRGIPNLVFGEDDNGFGHPGWDQANSFLTGPTTIESTSLSGKWKLRYDFDSAGCSLHVVKADPQRKYWFLYEGPIAGRWAPDEQYIATDSAEPTDTPLDYAAGDRMRGNWDWVYVGDRSVDRVLWIQHASKEKSEGRDDTFSHLGDSQAGLESTDGMVVLGLGRGSKGIDPQLTGTRSFRLEFINQAGHLVDQYEAIRAMKAR
ncbi:MAG: hypothetical protein AAGA03_09475 [Planctomycetota bacterium]